MRHDALLHGDATELVRLQGRERELRRPGSPAVHQGEAREYPG